jgi:hypothetical protein
MYKTDTFLRQYVVSIIGSVLNLQKSHLLAYLLQLRRLVAALDKEFEILVGFILVINCYQVWVILPSFYQNSLGDWYS